MVEHLLCSRYLTRSIRKIRVPVNIPQIVHDKSLTNLTKADYLEIFPADYEEGVGGSILTAEPDDYGAWAQVCGGFVKNRAFGFGPRQSARTLLGSIPPNTCSSSASAASPPWSQGLDHADIERAVDACLARHETNSIGSETSNGANEETLKSMMLNLFQTQMPLIVPHCIACLSNNPFVQQSLQAEHNLRSQPSIWPISSMMFSNALERGENQNTPHRQDG